MGRRTSAFTAELNDLDNLDNLPGLSPIEPTPAVQQAPSAAASPASMLVADQPDTPQPRRQRTPPTSPAPVGGTRATQVRLPPVLATWLSEEAHRSGRTLASVVALAAKAHQLTLPLAVPASADELDVSRRTATATVPVTLRLNGAQRELLDNLASQHTTTRSAVIVAALTAGRGDHLTAVADFDGERNLQ